MNSGDQLETSSQKGLPLLWIDLQRLRIRRSCGEVCMGQDEVGKAQQAFLGRLDRHRPVQSTL